MFAEIFRKILNRKSAPSKNLTNTTLELLFKSLESFLEGTEVDSILESLEMGTGLQEKILDKQTFVPVRVFRSLLFYSLEGAACDLKEYHDTDEAKSLHYQKKQRDYGILLYKELEDFLEKGWDPETNFKIRIPQKVESISISCIRDGIDSLTNPEKELSRVHFNFSLNRFAVGNPTRDKNGIKKGTIDACLFYYGMGRRLVGISKILLNNEKTSCLSIAKRCLANVKKFNNPQLTLDAERILKDFE